MSSNAVNNPTSATETVLNTTELLEHILSFLPMIQILGKTRVSRNWKAVVDGSPALQKRLFFRRPDSQAEVIWFDHWFPMPQSWSHLLSAEQTDLLCSLVNMPVYTTPIELNPYIDWVNQVDPHVSHEMRAPRPESYHPSVAGLAVILGKYSRTYVRHRFGDSPQKTQADSSWRSMYLTTPPISDVVINVPTSAGSFTVSEHIRVNVHAGGGITLGLLCDRLEETLRKFRMKDGRHRAQKKKDGPLREKDFVKGWGKKEHVMFLVQPEGEAVDHWPQ
jgi:hypothetical protein